MLMTMDMCIILDQNNKGDLNMQNRGTNQLNADDRLRSIQRDVESLQDPQVNSATLFQAIQFLNYRIIENHNALGINRISPIELVNALRPVIQDQLLSTESAVQAFGAGLPTVRDNIELHYNGATNAARENQPTLATGSLFAVTATTQRPSSLPHTPEKP